IVLSTAYAEAVVIVGAADGDFVAPCRQTIEPVNAAIINLHHAVILKPEAAALPLLIDLPQADALADRRFAFVIHHAPGDDTAFDQRDINVLNRFALAQRDGAPRLG